MRTFERLRDQRLSFLDWVPSQVPTVKLNQARFCCVPKIERSYFDLEFGIFEPGLVEFDGRNLRRDPIEEPLKGSHLSIIVDEHFEWDFARRARLRGGSGRSGLARPTALAALRIGRDWALEPLTKSRRCD
jgi:hypothetical protein